MLMVILIFVAVFAIAAPILIWSSGAHKAGKQEKVAEVLDNALGKSSDGDNNDPLSFRKADNSSNIPLLDRLLQRMDVIPRIALLLRQADLRWTPGLLVLMCVA